MYKFISSCAIVRHFNVGVDTIDKAAKSIIKREP